MPIESDMELTNKEEMMEIGTTSDERIYYNYGDGFVIRLENPHPLLYKEMPCGHQGLWVYDRWVCQTCWSYEKPMRAI